MLDQRETGGHERYVDDFTVTQRSTEQGSPALSIGLGNLTEFLTTVSVGPSASRHIVVNGSNLNNNVTVTAPNSYEISFDETDFDDTTPLTITPGNGAIEGKTVYIRLKDGLDLGSHNESLIINSDDVAQIIIPLTGKVIRPVPTQHVAYFQASAAVPPCSAIKVTWTNLEGENTPDGYLILAAKNGYNQITDPTDGVPVTASIDSKNVSGALEHVVFNQLDPLTNYYFKIYPYNNSGSYILYKKGENVPCAEAKTSKVPETFIFWNFNDAPASNQSWSSPIYSTNSKGELIHTLVSTKSFNGTTINAIDNAAAGGSFSIESGASLVNNGKYFTLAIPTTGYANIGLSYAVQRTPTGFNTYTIDYSLDGGTAYTTHSTSTDIPEEFDTRGLDFSSIPGVVNNPNFIVRITLGGATNANGNIKFDNIRVTGSEICTYETDIPVYITDGPTVTMIEGRANNSTENMPPIPNTSIGVDYFGLKLALLDEGFWTVQIEPKDDCDYAFCAYNWQGEWYDASIINGVFKITVYPTDGDSRDLFIVLADQNPTLPVELSSFLVMLNKSGMPIITWETQTETGVNGFYIYRSMSSNLNEAIMISSLIPATNSSLAHSYSFVDTDIFEDGTYYYWLNVSDLNGHESFHGPAELDYSPLDNGPSGEVPYNTGFKSIYPNPFNPSANIAFGLSEAGEVSISVYNVRGQLVRNFAPFTHDAGYGSIIWDGKDDGGNSVSSGLYLFRMKVGTRIYNIKALLLK